MVSDREGVSTPYERQLARRSHVAEEHVGDGVAALLPRVPGHEHRRHVAEPRHRDRAAALEHDDGARVERRDVGDELILAAREVEADAVAGADEALALVGGGEPDDDDRGVGRGDRRLVGGRQRRPGHVRHRDAARAGEDAVERRHGVDGATLLLPVSPRFADRRQAADHDDRADLRAIERQRPGRVLEQHDALARHLERQVDVRRALDLARVGHRRVGVEPEAELRAQDAAHGGVDQRHRHLAAGDGVDERLPVEDAGRHLDVEAGGDRGHGAARAEDPVGLDEALEAPVALQDVVQQVRVLGAVVPVHLVVGRHHRRGAASLHGLGEVRQVDLAQRPLVDRHVDAEARVLDAVGGEVLGVGDHVLLRAAHEPDRHAAEVERVLAVGLLRAAPARVAQHVDRRREEDARRLRARLLADRLADALLERRVPGRAARHADRERRGVPRPGAHAARPVDHAEAGDAERGRAGRAPAVAERAAVHLRDLLGERHLREQRVDARLDGVAGVAAEARVAILGLERAVGGATAAANTHCARSMPSVATSHGAPKGVAARVAASHASAMCVVARPASFASCDAIRGESAQAVPAGSA